MNIYWLKIKLNSSWAEDNTFLDVITNGSEDTRICKVFVQGKLSTLIRFIFTFPNAKVFVSLSSLIMLERSSEVFVNALNQAASKPYSYSTG